MPQIVTINESVVRGAMPNLLQQKGCLVSLGGTTLATGQTAELSSLADLSEILNTASTTGGNDTNSHGPAVTELNAQAQSWFANSSAGCWVLELGALETNAIEDALNSFLAQNPQLFYAYVLPRGVEQDPNLPSFLANQASSNARVYFFLCGDKDEAAKLLINGEGQKSVFYGAEYIGSVVRNGTTATNTTQEHLAAAVAAQFCSARPSALNRLAPMSFRQLTGITPWTEATHGPAFTDMKRNNIGFAGTSNEGGVQGSILFWGNFLNGDPMSEWYGADHVSINLELQLANLIIEDSQPGIRPLIYDQEGINRLTARSEQTLNSEVESGCILPSYTLKATDYSSYISANPSDYTTGTYNGLAATVVPVRGFTSLTFNLAIDFSGQTATSTVTTAGA